MSSQPPRRRTIRRRSRATRSATPSRRQATRFQPGKSGNPKGRPKGSRKAPPADTAVEKLNALVLQEAYRTIKIKDGETLVELPVIQAAVRSVTLSAAKGNQRSQRLLLDSVGEIERERRRERLKLFEEAVAYKVEAEREMAMAAARHLPAPVLVPHPDHLIIDPITGSVKLRGPFTREEKVEWDEHTAMKATLTKAAHRAGGGAAGRTPQPQSEEADRGLSVSDCPGGHGPEFLRANPRARPVLSARNLLGK